jgi:hypothetical protein
LPGRIYKVDLVLVKRSTVISWSRTGDVNYLVDGAWVAGFFEDPAPPPEEQTIAHQKKPVGGVSVDRGTYLDAPDHIDLGLTATAAHGLALVEIAPGVTSMVTGTGGGRSWETEQAVLLPGVVQVVPFHPKD